ncbi:phosphate ABC transporter permease PstA [Luteolibacter yonseiensis]|uniref:Phosphate ABC transporter permease PstA n=1 Tax=Luteolibacter yonseiensis TaxID=1144680 RepID=A0A934VA03_9BACT|nr:PstA family ABC transporter permease [Luteolibacter yonseiensis]MBK1814341.1 phosphate ABC transporter permease PstA [Luteolibacter yonseiensis]
MSHPDKLIRKGLPKGHFKDVAVRFLLGGGTYFIVLIAALLFGKIIVDGAPVLFKAEAPFVDFDFLTAKNQTLHVFDDAQGTRHQLPASEYSEYLKKNEGKEIFNEQSYSYSGGGIAGPIVGTALLTVGSMIIALFFGVCAAIYLSEYAKQSPFIHAVRLAILNLAGIPSIVFGLFGFSVFVLAVPVITAAPSDRSLLVIPLLIGDYVMSFQGWNSSLMAGCATLACMILPVIITASEESLRAVPQGFRDASLAMGATRWQTIRKCVLPFSLPGILTSSLLSIARVAGETAPIMFTAAVAAKDDLPWQGLKSPFDLLSSQVQALPYHIYTLAARIPNSEYTQRAQFGSVFVFLLLVAFLSAGSMILRAKLRAKLKW